MSDWQDIATAPKDGRYILVWDADAFAPHQQPSVVIVCWGVAAFVGNEADPEWLEWGGCSAPNRPTHWQPLPPPPEPPR